MTSNTPSTTYDIELIPGDGIGTEVVDAAMPLVRTVADEYGFAFETTRRDWGTEYYLDHGEMMPDDGLDRLASADSIFLGAVGHPDVPDHVTLHGLLLPIRKGFDQYVCKRPNVLFEGIESPLRGYEAGDIDFVVYRENTEGEYADVGGREHRELPHETAIQSACFEPLRRHLDRYRCPDYREYGTRTLGEYPSRRRVPLDVRAGPRERARHCR